MHSEFEVIGTLLPQDVAVLNPMEYRTSSHRHCACARHQNTLSHKEVM